jgi:predicted transcriptional regulator
MDLCHIPNKKIVGTFVIGEIIKDTPDNLWKNLNELSGLTEQEFFDYFSGMKMGFALELEYTKFFEVPIGPKMIFHDFSPPQSFYYFDDSLITAMIKIEPEEHN